MQQPLLSEEVARTLGKNFGKPNIEAVFSVSRTIRWSVFRTRFLLSDDAYRCNTDDSFKETVSS